jgi:hypothetical protein
VGFSDRDLQFLLSAGKLPGPEKDRILEQVLGKHGARPFWRRGWPQLGMALSLAGATAALVVVARPHEEATDGLVSRGGKGGAPVELDVSCRGADLSACPVGATLMFAVTGETSGGRLLAWAEPAEGGERIWYFRGAAAPTIAAGAGTRPVARGINLGSEHAVGRYLVTLMLVANDADVPRPADIVAKRTVSLTVSHR